MSFRRLLWYKLKIFLARFRSIRGRRRYFALFSIALFGFLIFGFISGVGEFFSVLSSLGADGRLAGTVVLIYAFHAILILALIFGIGTTTAMYFLSSDLNLLIAAPLNPVKVFGIKYLEAFATGSTFPLFVGVPILVGYGLGFHPPLVYYPFSIIVLIVFLSIPVSLGSLCAIAIARYVAPSRIREVLGFVSGVIAVGIWIGFQLVRPAVGTTSGATSLIAKARILASGTWTGALKILPSYQAAITLSAISDGNLPTAGIHLIYLMAGAGALFLLSVIIAQRMYLTGWTRIGVAKTIEHKTVRIVRLFSWLPHCERGIVPTTVLLFIRDPQQITPIATIAVILIAFPFIAIRSAGSGALDPRIFMLALTGLAFIGCLNAAMNSVVIDGKAFWRLLCAPVSSKRKILGKSIMPPMIFIPLAWAMAILIKIVGLADWGFVLKSAWIVIWTSIVGTSVGALLGISFGNWEWDIPKRMVRTRGRIAMAIILGLYFAAIQVIIRIPTNSLLGKSEIIEKLGLMVLLPAASLVIAYTLVKISSRKLDSMEWML